MRSSELSQRLENLRIVRLLPKLVDFHPSDLALLVHNEHRAIVDEGYLVFGRGENTIIRRSFGVWPAIRNEGKLQTPKRFLESNMGENSVCADAHDLGVQAGKPGEVRLDCRQVFLSNGGKVKGVEADHHILVAIGGKLKLTLGSACCRAEPEIRCLVSNL